MSLPVLLPAFIAEGLGLGLGATIMPGSYSIVREAEGYGLCFLLNRQPSGQRIRETLGRPENLWQVSAA